MQYIFQEAGATDLLLRQGTKIILKAKGKNYIRP
jgi:hypothetical protein